MCRLHSAAACDVEHEPAARTRGCGSLPEQLLPGQAAAAAHHRQCMRPSLSTGLNGVCGRDSLRAYAALMNEASAALIVRLGAAAAAGAPIDIHAALGDMTMQVVGSTAFGRAPRLLLACRGGAALKPVQRSLLCALSPMPHHACSAGAPQSCASMQMCKMRHAWYLRDSACAPKRRQGAMPGAGAAAHRVDFQTQAGGATAGAAQSQEARRLTEAVTTVFDLQTGAPPATRGDACPSALQARWCTLSLTAGALLTWGARRAAPAPGWTGLLQLIISNLPV